MRTITIRHFETGDEEDLFKVFFSAIHQVCSFHYTGKQIQAWAPRDLDPNLWNAKIQSIKPFVALLDEKIVGYADLQSDGKIDHFFVHGDHQTQGIGRKLMTTIIDDSNRTLKLYSEVSKTAQPFFEKYGFRVVKTQTVKMRGVELSNSIMERQD